MYLLKCKSYVHVYIYTAANTFSSEAYETLDEHTLV